MLLLTDRQAGYLINQTGNFITGDENAKRKRSKSKGVHSRILHICFLSLPFNKNQILASVSPTADMTEVMM